MLLAELALDWLISMGGCGKPRMPGDALPHRHVFRSIRVLGSLIPSQPVGIGYAALQLLNEGELFFFFFFSRAMHGFRSPSAVGARMCLPGRMGSFAAHPASVCRHISPSQAGFITFKSLARFFSSASPEVYIFLCSPVRQIHSLSVKNRYKSLPDWRYNGKLWEMKRSLQ